MGARAKNVESLLRRTRKELRRQVVIAVAMLALAPTMIVAVEAPLLWVVLVGSAAVVGAIFVHFARRGIWLMIWRGTFLLINFVGLSLSLFLAAYGDSQLIFDVFSQLKRTPFVPFCIAGLLLGIVYHYFNNIPYWHDTYERNLARKIDLQKGTFSVVVDWARRTHVSYKTHAWIWGLTVVVGPALGRFLSGSSGTITQIGPLAIAFFLFVCGIGFALSEYYYAYKVWRLERKIGKPLIIDAYAAKQPTNANR